MDEENQDIEKPSNEPAKSPSGNAEATGDQPLSSGKRTVIQPSKESIEEIKTALNAPPETPQPAPQTDPNKAATPLSPQMVNIPANRPSPSSIYPEPTKGLNTAVPKTTDMSDQPPSIVELKDNKTASNNAISIIIVVLGLYIALVSLLGLISGVRQASLGIKGVGDLIYAIDIVYLVLGVGIIFKKELARIIYIVLAVLGLLLSIYTTYHYYKVDKTYFDTQYSSSITSEQKTIKTYQNNNSIPADQKAQILKELQNDLNHDKQQQQNYKSEVNKINQKTEISFIEGYALAIIPLVFLTRPSVKKEFG